MRGCVKIGSRDLIAEFGASYYDYHGLSDGRRRESRRLLRLFAEAVAPRALTDATANDVQDHLNDRLKTCAPSTVRQDLNVIRPFFAWMWRTKLVDAERLMEVRELRPPRGASAHLPRPYKRTEIQQLWRDLDAKYPVWPGVGTAEQRAEMYLRRWQRGQSRWSRVQSHAKRTQLEAIIWLALGAGLRRIEIFTLSLDDMDPINDYIAVGGAAKNREGVSHPRAVPWCSDDVNLHVHRWLALRDELEPDHESPWLSLHQDHYLKAMRFRQFKMLMRQIGRGYEFHRLRHTFATEQLRSGQKLEKLQKIMGHHRITQTLLYTQILEGDVVKAAAKVESDFSRALRRAA